MSAVSLPVEIYRGYQIEIVAWFHACRTLGLYGFANVRTLRRAIDRAVASRR